MAVGQDVLTHMPDQHRKDDIARGLRASLTAVLTTTLAANDTNLDFLRGVFSLAMSQAALYGIHWSDLISSLTDIPELGRLPSRLQTGAMASQRQRRETQRTS